MAIRAMHKVVQAYPDAILILAGNGPMEDELISFIRQEGLENNVKMIGYVTNLQDYQHIIDVQVCCSRREGLPLNVVESMLSGNPVVASKNRGHKELIKSDTNGFLVDMDDSDAMSDKILLMLNDEDEKTRIKTNAMKFASLYTFTNVKKELGAIYGLSNELN
jgi:glycosyltransferase EpsD